MSWFSKGFFGTPHTEPSPGPNLDPAGPAQTSPVTAEPADPGVGEGPVRIQFDQFGFADGSGNCHCETLLLQFSKANTGQMRGSGVVFGGRVALAGAVRSDVTSCCLMVLNLSRNC